MHEPGAPTCQVHWAHLSSSSPWQPVSSPGRRDTAGLGHGYAAGLGRSSGSGGGSGWRGHLAASPSTGSLAVLSGGAVAGVMGWPVEAVTGAAAGSRPTAQP